MDLNDLNKVWEVRPLNQIGKGEARKIFEQVAEQVKLIMQKRHWKVKILSEFCPPYPSLMGLNIDGCSEIRLRLRKQNNEWAFFPYERILHTMLHELCHNEVGPHNADFYRLCDEIRKANGLSVSLNNLSSTPACPLQKGKVRLTFGKSLLIWAPIKGRLLCDIISEECEKLMAKGITGSGKGFDLPRRRLGGLSRQPPPPAHRQTALAAADERGQTWSSLLPPKPSLDDWVEIIIILRLRH